MDDFLPEILIALLFFLFIARTSINTFELKWIFIQKFLLLFVLLMIIVIII